MGTMFKTGSQLLGINGSIYKFNTSIASIIKPLDPQPTNSVDDMCIDDLNNRLFVTVRGTGQVWVYDTITLTRIAIIPGFSSFLFIRKDPNPTNNRITVYDYYNSQFRFIDLTSLELSSTMISNSYGSGKFEYDQNVGRNQILACINTSSIAILDATTFALIQQISDPLFNYVNAARRSAHNPDEIYVFSGGYSDVIVVNMADLSYKIKSFSTGVSDADADPNLSNNRIYAVYGGTYIYTASDLGFIKNLNFPAAFTVVADPKVANHRLFFGGNSLLFTATLG